MPSQPKVTVTVERKVRPSSWLLALAFTLGELWGHTGHGVPWSHQLVSAAVSFVCVVVLLDIPWRDWRVQGTDT